MALADATTALWPYGGPGCKYGSFAGKAASPPSFSGTIADISVTENTGTHDYDLSVYFSGATEYSIAPAVETGWNFDTVTGILTIDTDEIGVFGPFVVTGTNLAGSDDSNAFSIEIEAAAIESVGGHSGWPERKKKKRRIDELRERVEAMVDEVVAEEVPVVAEVTSDEPPPITKSAQKRIQRQVVRRIADTGEFDTRIEAIEKAVETLVNENLAARRIERKRLLAEKRVQLQKRQREEQDLIAILMLIDSDGAD